MAVLTLTPWLVRQQTEIFLFVRTSTKEAKASIAIVAVMGTSCFEATLYEKHVLLGLN